MKAHIGADADSGLVHTLVGTAANVSDVSRTEHLFVCNTTEARAR